MNSKYIINKSNRFEDLKPCCRQDDMCSREVSYFLDRSLFKYIGYVEQVKCHIFVLNLIMLTEKYLAVLLLFYKKGK